MNNTCIYGLVDPINGELRYIGKTVQKLKNRYASHLSVSKYNKRKDHTHCWIKSLLDKGLKPEIIIIENNTTIEDEIFYISYFKFLGCNLTNHTIGGDNGTLGHRWKISEEKKKSLKPKNGKQVYQYDKEGNFIQKWDTINAFFKFYGLKSGNLSLNIKDRNLHNGYVLLREGEKFIKPQNYLNRPVLILDSDNNLIKECIDTKEVCKLLEVSKATVCGCIKDKRKILKKYYLKYK